jgi:GDP-L-fucose synthase
MTRILVTGGSGLIGKALQFYVFHSDDIDEIEWIFLSSKDLNLLNEDNTINYLENNKPDIVIHLAARVGGLYNNMNNNERMLSDNMKMNMNIIQACEKAGVKRFISALSTCIFPDAPPSLPLTEDMIHSGPPHHSNEGYSMAKRMLEVQCRLSKIETICLIPTNLFGPYDNFAIEDAHVIPALIHKCYLARKEGRPFKVAGSGKAVRQFLYNGDMASIVYWAALKKYNVKNNHETYICAPDEKDEVTIETVARIISKKMNYPVEFDVSYAEGQQKKTASNRKLLDEMRDLTFSPFERKMCDTIDWFIANYNVVRK